MTDLRKISFLLAAALAAIASQAAAATEAELELGGREVFMAAIATAIAVEVDKRCTGGFFADVAAGEAATSAAMKSFALLNPPEADVAGLGAAIERMRTVAELDANANDEQFCTEVGKQLLANGPAARFLSVR
ncbi:MAG: hypothetical protein ACI9ZH_000616 [Paracoccaceae bacterium]|jgi:hypothetical protein